MKAESLDYVELQNIYRQKATSDLIQVAQNISQILASLNRPESGIPEEDISLWCRNANHVRRIRYRPLIDEWMIDLFHAKAVCTFFLSPQILFLKHGLISLNPQTPT